MSCKGGHHKEGHAWRCGLASSNAQFQMLNSIKNAEAFIPDGALPDPMKHSKAGVTKKGMHGDVD